MNTDDHHQDAQIDCLSQPSFQEACPFLLAFQHQVQRNEELSRANNLRKNPRLCSSLQPQSWV
jgi:hypothetical protein